jgi:transcription initiation factor TFIIIB Brf1 subunit/transcription initiation factor TFIIB
MGKYSNMKKSSVIKRHCPNCGGRRAIVRGGIYGKTVCSRCKVELKEGKTRK